MLELAFVLGQPHSRHDFEQLAEVLAAVEPDPLHFGVEDQIGANEVLAELGGVDAVGLES